MATVQRTKKEKKDRTKILNSSKFVQNLIIMQIENVTTPLNS